ncbi:hypothetical protein BscR1v2_016350 (plasmid) [Bartonella schoenbuchensis R1]|uniref:Uncharacterized protein n=2 Tax=Bartonella schoenbuchensis TaxID=165694 RepID=A0A1S6XSN1_BARSR|nr:hypothetical protein BscR1v2_016350 [Bartonella schoenbuchensis R1]ENN90467.1 hypothetical protein m07a_pML00580 [Bartonella schoenbuchensis m07a]
MPVISFANSKGGSGKTTSALKKVGQQKKLEKMLVKTMIYFLSKKKI